MNYQKHFQILLTKHSNTFGVTVFYYLLRILRFQKSVNNKREIVTTAFIGLNGQDRYTLTVKFGNKSRSRYARDLDIKECIPDVTADDWYDIDITKKTLTIRLL